MKSRARLPALVVVALALASASAGASDEGDTSARDGRFTLSARVDPDPVTFGERFDLVIDVVRAEGDRLSLPRELPEQPDARRLGPPQRALTPLGPDEHGVARVREVVRVPYLALGLDDVKTPALVLTAPDGEVLEVASLPVRVKADAAATAPPPDDVGQALEEAERVLTFEVFDARPLYGAGALAFAGVAFVLARWLARKRREWLARRPAPAVPVAPTRPAHVIALERLDALLAEGLLARGEVNRFVERLMDEVLRDYLERRYRVAAGRRTTSELLGDLLSVSAPGLDLDVVRGLGDDADLVKFARADLAVEVAHGMASRLRALIEATAERDEEGAA